MTRASTLQSRLEALHRNKFFELTVIFIIIFSALLVGARTYDEVSRFDRIIGILDWVVTGFFLVEILIRMAAEQRLSNFFRSGWNVFDFTIVVASLIPINESEMVLVARLLRIFRVLRLVSLIPELRVLVSSLLIAIPRMGYVALLMFIIFYIYAAVGSFWFHEVDESLWGNIALAMLTLFQVATFESWATAVLYPTMEHHPYSWVFFLTFIFFNAFIFLNMMIGIVLQVMEKESTKASLESGEGEAAQINQMHAQMQSIQEQLARMEARLERRD
ncbi:MAG: ion transporter [Oleiphilaceae bacterium]|nr:ion transporter [Oleiphilaceae bacterium]